MEEAKNKLGEYSKEGLISLLINQRYNDFVSQYSDYKDEEKPQDPTAANGRAGGKRVPYIGWFWRSVDFANKEISLGDCGEFIGIMENNKWGYPERLATEEEASKIISIIEASMRQDEKGGELSELRRKTLTEIEKLSPYLQTLSI